MGIITDSIIVAKPQLNYSMDHARVTNIGCSRHSVDQYVSIISIAPILNELTSEKINK